MLPLLGDTVRLSADLLVQVPDTTGDTCGRLRLSYIYANNNPALPDSVVPVGSVGFLGGRQALCGLGCLSTALCPARTDGRHKLDMDRGPGRSGRGRTNGRHRHGNAVAR